MVEKKRVCKECGTLTLEKECPTCSSKSFVDKYKGRVVILDEQSDIAKRLNIEKKGNYAMKY